MTYNMPAWYVVFNAEDGTFTMTVHAPTRAAAIRAAYSRVRNATIKHIIKTG